MATLHEIIYNVKTTTQADPKVDKMFDAIKSLKDAVDKLNNTPVAPKVSDKAGQGLDDLAKKAKKTEGVFAGLGKTVLAFFAFDMLKNVATSIVKTGSDYEMMQLQLNNLTGSAVKGAEAFRMFQADAAKMPYDVADIVRVNAGIMAMGLNAKESQKSTNALANAVAFAGKGTDVFARVGENMAQIKSKGGADSVDIKQFQTAGIQINKALEASTGKSMKELEKAPITFEMISTALEKAALSGGIFANGIESLSKSSAVKLSNLGDSFATFSYNLFLDLQGGINGIIDLLSDLMVGVQNVINFMKEHKEMLISLGSAIAVVTVAMGIYNIQQNWMAIKSGITTTALIIQAVATGNLTVAMALAGVTASLMWIAITGGIALVVAGIVYIYRNFDMVSAKMSELGQKAKRIFTGIWEVIKQVFLNIGDFFVKTFDPIFEAIENIRNGNFLAAGKNVVELMFNLTPAGLATTAVETIGKDTGKAFQKGFGDGIKIQTNAPTIPYLNKPATSMFLGPQPATNTAEDKVTDKKVKKTLTNSAKGNQNVLKNITISFEALQKIMGDQNINKDNGRDVLETLNSGFMQILNNSYQIINR